MKMMMCISLKLSIIVALLLVVVSYCNGLSFSRRDMLRTSFTAATSVLAVPSTLLIPNNNNANAAQDEEEIIEKGEELMDVYFGCGCFWHVQHEFVEAERKILNRGDALITARAGYAGGLVPSDKVCYHNALNVGDYGSLGHAEVVALRIPPSSFASFAKEYFKLFDKDGNRADQFGDRGPEYRNLIGIPGGSKSPYASQIIAASQEEGDKLDFAVGKGNDRDARAVSFIMDSTKFPFFVAEQYHQFHDGFNFGENYPNAYNALASKLAGEGKLGDSSCPNGTLGIGVLGL